MPNRSRRRRSAATRVAARRRASVLADRLGKSLRTIRIQAGLTQLQIADRAGVSQSFVSQAERGLGAHASIETWACLASAAGYQLAAFIELAAGATPPRDIQHIRRQQAVIELAAQGGWVGRAEVPITTPDGIHRFVDVVMDRPATNEVLVVEIVDLLADIGEDLRGLERKIEAVRGLMPDCRVAGLLVIRATLRNRTIVQELATLLAARFATGPGWLRGLTSANPLPEGEGLLWSASQSTQLTPVRLRPGFSTQRR